nr:TIGR02680 family protein [Saccharopolyspora sp. HNM0983]
MHRGGIVNIWQYAESTFDLSGGRAIFQGTNGSGKSRTLELLLPLCLDGDLRQLGSKGFDTVSMRRLMLDEYPGGPNRIGYAWVELRREGPDGEEEFLTCGVGVKASRTSQSISDSWRFITSRRVGTGLHLVGPERVPLSSAQLRDELGADCVLDDQAFRAKVAATVYGVPAARYGDLLHLQRTLRNPDVGLKVLEGQLEQILSDALPPLDAGLIERLATSFDDLESIRENIVRLTGADEALGRFLSTYSGYALAALRDRAASMRTAQDKLGALRGELSKLDGQVAGKRQHRETAQAEIAELERRESELESSVDALRSHPAYSELQNLRDREKLVESGRASAVAALDTANRHRSQENRSAESVAGVLRRLATDVDAADQAAGHAREQLSTAGLGGADLPALPRVPAAELGAEQARVRTTVEPDAEPLAIQRPVVPAFDAEALSTELGSVSATCAEAVSTARRHAALVLSLHQQSVELDAERDRVDDLHKQARQVQLSATEASGRRNQADQQLADATADWTERARTWIAEWPSTSDDPAPEPPKPDTLAEDPDAPRRSRERIRQWARPQLQQARTEVAAAEREIADLRELAGTGEQELAELRSGREHAPQPPGWTTADRDPATGRAFHRLVDFRADLGDRDRAGLEAALQASGLLSAWVSAGGEVPDLAELLARPGDPVDGPHLGELLVPAADQDSPVPNDRVAALLAAVPTGDGAGLAVSVTGSWRAGVLTGTWHKEAAEFVGSGAREAARDRRVAELEEELARLRERIGRAEQRHREAADRTTALEQHLESYPGADEVLTAHTRCADAIEAAGTAEQQAAQLREQHREADQRRQAQQAELTRATGEAGLPADTAALDAARRAAAEAGSAIESLREAVEARCLPTLHELRDIALHHDVAVADRMEAESQAESRCTEHAEQQAALDELGAAVGGQAEEVADKVSALERERTEVRDRLPKAREELSSLRESAARLETQLENKQSQLAGRERDADEATEAFRTALRAPGVWAAAGAGEQPAELDEAARLVAAAEGKGSTEATVLNRLQALQHSLSGGYDITAADQDGLLTVTVTGEEGPQPVAEAARQVAERLAEQRGYLNERYQSIFADYLIRDLAERLRSQIGIADDLCARMNEVLDGARSSQGVHVQLDWQPSAALGEDIRQAIELVRTPFAERSEDQDALLRRVFTGLIEAERDSTSGGYAEILARALDYRSWFAFTVRVRDSGPDGKPRVRRLRQLSSGETRLISYVTLFAAAAAFYDAVSVSADGRGPLRLVLLDEAFERLDDPTIARMLGLLVDLDMDWLITWPSGWGVSPKIPRMHIYDVLRPRSGHGIACTHTTWDGADLQRSGGW